MLPTLPAVRDPREVVFDPRGYALWRGSYYLTRPAPEAVVIQGPWTATDENEPNGEDR